MQYGLFTCGYQRTTLEKAFADAKAFGYDYIELWGGRPHAYGPDLVRPGSGQLERIRNYIDSYEMPVRIYTPEHNAYPFNYMLGDERQWKECMSYLKCCLQASSLLGARGMLISVGHGGDASCLERRDRLIKSLRVLAETAGDLGQELYVETLTKYESNTCVHLEELCAVLSEVEEECLYGMCDIVAPFSCGEDPAEYARQAGARMRHLHLVDNDGRSEIHLIPGDGVMPLEQILRDIKAAGYDDTATIELVTNYMDDPSTAAAKAMERVRELERRSMLLSSAVENVRCKPADGCKKKIICLGDNCVDYYDETKEAFFGGNPVNVAVYLRRLGRESSYIGAVGDDVFGQQMARAIAERGVDLSHLKILAGSTALTHVLIRDGDRILGEYEEGVMADFRLEEEDFRFISQHCLAVTGLWGHCAQFWEKIHSLGVATAFDAADQPDDPEALKALPHTDLFFFSDDGSEEEALREQLEKLHKCGPEIVIATRGEKGSLAYDGKAFVSSGIVDCSVTDTMGAGDSYIAGFADAWTKGLSLKHCMEAGAACSAVTLAYQGAW